MQLAFNSFEVGAWVVVFLLAIFWLNQVMQGRQEEENPKEQKKEFGRRGPDMAFSAGRDAAQQNARFLQVFIPMEPHEETIVRHFYLEVLDLTEMRAPNYPANLDGFWATSGSRQIYFGTHPNFAFDASTIPAFPIADIDGMAARLTAEGYRVTWNKDIPYVKRLVVTDPNGLQIGLIES